MNDPYPFIVDGNRYCPRCRGGLSLQDEDSAARVAADSEASGSRFVVVCQSCGTRLFILGRRACLRVPLGSEAKVVQSGKASVAKISDLSTGDIFLLTGEDLPHGPTVNVDFELPDGSKVRAVGVVCRSAIDEGVAVRFVTVKNRFLRRIQHFIERFSLHHF